MRFYLNLISSLGFLFISTYSVRAACPLQEVMDRLGLEDDHLGLLTHPELDATYGKLSLPELQEALSRYEKSENYPSLVKGIKKEILSRKIDIQTLRELMHTTPDIDFKAEVFIKILEQLPAPELLHEFYRIQEAQIQTKILRKIHEARQNKSLSFDHAEDLFMSALFYPDSWVAETAASYVTQMVWTSNRPALYEDLINAMTDPRLSENQLNSAVHTLFVDIKTMKAAEPSAKDLKAGPLRLIDQLALKMETLKASPRTFKHLYEALDELNGIQGLENMRLTAELHLRQAMIRKRDAALGEKQEEWAQAVDSMIGPKATIENERLIEDALFHPPQTEQISPLQVEGFAAPLEIHEVREWEHRVNLGSAQIPSQTVTRILDDYFVGQSWDEKHSSPFSKRGHEMLSFQPLESRTEDFHSARKRGERKKKYEARETLTTEFQGKEVEWGTFSWESRQPNTSIPHYIVAHQREHGIYYDTPQRDLERSGFAIRIKEWYPPDAFKDNARPTPLKRVLYLKKQAGSEGPFTLRDEIFIPLPTANPDSKIDSLLIAALLKKTGLQGIDSKTLRPVAQVENNRHGFDLVAYGRFKIGFIVIDNFSRYNLTPSGSKDHATSMIPQYEIELLPEWENFYQANKVEFTRFLEELQKKLGGKLTLTPKYLQKGDYTP